MTYVCAIQLYGQYRVWDHRGMSTSQTTHTGWTMPSPKPRTHRVTFGWSAHRDFSDLDSAVMYAEHMAKHPVADDLLRTVAVLDMTATVPYPTLHEYERPST